MVRDVRGPKRLRFDLGAAVSVLSLTQGSGTESVRSLSKGTGSQEAPRASDSAAKPHLRRNYAGESCASNRKWVTQRRLGLLS
jgi:hypothetical protein